MLGLFLTNANMCRTRNTTGSTQVFWEFLLPGKRVSELDNAIVSTIIETNSCTSHKGIVQDNLALQLDHEYCLSVARARV